MSIITRRTSALAGIAIAPLWLGVTSLLTWVEWDYIHSVGWGARTENEVPYPSVLLRGDYGLVQSANFVVTGVLVAIFALGLRREFTRRISGWVATVGLAVLSLGTIMNAGTTDLGDEPSTMSGTVHVTGFALVLIGALFTYPATGLALRGNPDWRCWRLLGWWPVLLVAVAFTNLGLPGDLGFCVFVVLVWVWFALMSGRLLAIERAGRVRPESAPLPNAAAPGLL
jgi:hypothetical protein